MSKLTCSVCGNIWDDSVSPFCPSCLEHNWEASTGFIQPKHDPRRLPNYYDKYRSVVTMDFITNRDEYINTLVYSGTYYYDTQYRNFTCFMNQPLGSVSGSAIPANYPWPTHPLDSQKVVSINYNPHVYAVDFDEVKIEIAQGRLVPARMCEMVGCSNLAIPGTKRCSRH